MQSSRSAADPPARCVPNCPNRAWPYSKLTTIRHHQVTPLSSGFVVAWPDRNAKDDGQGLADEVGRMMRKCQPLPEEDEGEEPNVIGTPATPFSESMEDINGPSNGSSPDLVNHPHLDNSMRSMSTSVASRRKEYMQKGREAESQQQQQRTSNMSRAERIAVMKRTRSVSTHFPLCLRFRVCSEAIHCVPHDGTTAFGGISSSSRVAIFICATCEILIFSLLLCCDSSDQFCMPTYLHAIAVQWSHTSADSRALTSSTAVKW